MAKWRKGESLGHVLAREGRSIVKGVGKEILSIATLGLFRPKKYGSSEEIVGGIGFGQLAK
jgi:hypothetical protein